MSTWPKVSVIICCHQRPSVLPRALDSLLAQTFRGFETCVIHDGPPDEGTMAVCKEYEGRFEEAGLEFEFSSTDEESKYYCVPRNMAIGMLTRGDYIAHLDDDNFFYPYTLQVMVDAIEAGTEWPDFVYGRIQYAFEEGAAREFNGQALPEGLAPLQPWDDMAIARLAAGPMSNFIDTSSFMAARGAYWRLYLATQMMFNEGYRRFGDWELLTRAVHFAGWRGKAIDKAVVVYNWGTPGQIQLNRAANERVEGKVI